MKLETTITPREEGNVLVELDGKEYNFAPDESGSLVADVEDEKHVAHLLNLETFVPVNEADFVKAADLANAGNDNGDEDDEGDEDDDELSDPNAAPVEGVGADGQQSSPAPIENPASAVAAAPAKPVAAKASAKKK